MIDPNPGRLQKDWQKRINTVAPVHQLTTSQAQKILAARVPTSTMCSSRNYQGGYTIVRSRDRTWLRISIRGGQPLHHGRNDVRRPSYSFTAEAGEATLVLEVRDSLTKRTDGRALDRRERRAAGMQMTTSVTNQRIPRFPAVGQHRGERASRN